MSQPALFAEPLQFTVYCHPEPQGSSKAYVRGGRAIVTSANAKLKPFRHIVTAVAREHCPELLAGKHVPVSIRLSFYFERPPSIPKKRTQHVVKPDIDKLIRATCDALTGVIYADDAQVVFLLVNKFYGSPERVEITASICN